MRDGGGLMDYTFGDVAAYEDGLLVHEEYLDPDPVAVLARFHELARGARDGSLAERALADVPARLPRPSTGLGCAPLYADELVRRGPAPAMRCGIVPGAGCGRRAAARGVRAPAPRCTGAHRGRRASTGNVARRCGRSWTLGDPRDAPAEIAVGQGRASLRDDS